MKKMKFNTQVSLTQVLDQARPLFKNQPATWLGRKIFLSYSNRGGWKVQQLGLFYRILRKLGLAFCNTHLKFVLSKFKDLNPKEALLLSNHSYLKNLKALHCGLKNILISHSSQCCNAKIPLSLINYKNRCYLDSVLELILSQNEFRKKILDQFAMSKGDEDKRKVLEPLVDLLSSCAAIDNGLNTSAAAENIRQAIFDCSLDKDLELQDKTKISQQLDAAAILQFFMHHLLSEPILTSYVDIVSHQGKLVELERPVSQESLLQIPMIGQVGSSLEDYLADLMGLKTIADQRFFMINDKKEQFDTYSTKAIFKSLPDNLSIHLARFDFDGNKLNDPISLPKDGVLDFTPYCKDTQLNKYVITGYVVHEGNSLNAGHYISFVKIGEKYYKCNNEKTPPYKEISKDIFFANKKYFLIQLKRI